MAEVKFHCFKKVRQNEYIRLNDSDSVDEVDSFALCLESDSVLENYIVLITDIPIGISFISSKGNKFWYQLNTNDLKQYFVLQGFEDSFEKYYLSYEYSDLVNSPVTYTKLFINYPIGLCDISLFDKTSDSSVQKILINIVSSKIDENEFASLVSYVEEKGTSIWSKFSLLKHTADKLNDQSKLEWLLNLCENFTSELQTKYLSLFSIDKIKSIKPKHEVIDYFSNVNISEESLFWLANNLDVLIPTISSDTNKVLLNNRLLRPIEILASNYEESTNVSENHLMHGFINEMKLFLIDQKEELEVTATKTEHTKFEDLIELYSTKRSLHRIKDLLLAIDYIKYNFDKNIPVSLETLEFLNANRIESKEHYSFVYHNLLEWQLFKDATFSINRKFFKGISRMDKLFERACFFKLIDAFVNLEYEYEIIQKDKDDFPSRVKFIKGGVVHFLNFELIPDSLATVKGNSNVLKPDFTIELENKKFIVFDAKYKKQHNIFKYDLLDLSLKYLHGIGLKDGGFFNPLGLFILYPDQQKHLNFYQKREYNLFSETPALPSIGSIALNFDDNSMLLTKCLQKLLNMAEE